MTREYVSKDLTIVWKPEACIHSTRCWKGLGAVFTPSRRPWIDPNGAQADAIMQQIDQCPSGALSYRKNQTPGGTGTSSATRIEIMPGGPLVVYGSISIKDQNGNDTLKDQATAFCRCGQSANKPYCDGSHRKIRFDG